MKRIRKGNTTEVLGLTQMEMAMILNVTRSQFSHYEANTRILPGGAGRRVSEMIVYMFSPEAKALKSLSKPEYQDNKTKSIVVKRLKENEYQLMAIARKVAKEQEKVEKYSKAATLIDFLSSTEEGKKLADPEGLRSVVPTVSINIRESKSKLRLLLIDQELLQKEKIILETALEEEVSK